MSQTSNNSSPQSSAAIVEKPRTELLLEQLLEEQVKQGRQMRSQLRWTQWVATGCMALTIIFLILCLTIMPKAASLLGKANLVVTEIHTTVQTLNETLPGTLKELDRLVNTNSAGITKALTDVQGVLQKLNAFDIESLNEAIADLAGVVKPLSALFGR